MTLALDIFPSQLRKIVPSHSKILSILQASDVLPARLELEITESALVRDLEGAQEILGSLRAAGVKRLSWTTSALGTRVSTICGTSNSTKSRSTEASLKLWDRERAPKL